MSVHRTEQCIVVHRLEPCSNASLRVRWLKVCIDEEGKESTTPGAKPSTARLAMSEVLEVVTISRDGVLNARATRRFSKQDWTYDSSRVEGADTQRSEGRTGFSALQAAEADAKAGAFATFAEATSASTRDPDETLKRLYPSWSMIPVRGACHPLRRVARPLWLIMPESDGHLSSLSGRAW